MKSAILNLIFYLFLYLACVIRPVLACFTPPEQYSWSDQKLIYCTEDIFIGEYDGSMFKVEKTLKGKTKTGDIKKNYLFNTSKDTKTILAITPDCSFVTRFVKGLRYIVFLNTTSNKSYMLRSDKRAEEWIRTISKYKSDKAFKSDCRIQYNLSPFL